MKMNIAKNTSSQTNIASRPIYQSKNNNNKQFKPFKKIKFMEKFLIPTKNEVSESNQAIFTNLEKSLGFVPNLYAYYGKSETALADYLALQNRKSTLKAKEREVVNIITSQINGCRYCQSAHTLLGKMNGFTDEQIIELRKGVASFDSKLDALVKFSASVVSNRGNATQQTKDAFFKAGYSEVNMIDVVMVVGDKIISNYIHNLTDFAIDFPLAPEL
jgi:AhpD family alkylhydroperoxidase